MADALRPFLLLLVLQNLAFVHITGAVAMSWLLPLYALAAAAPLLGRLHRHLWYRVAWNLAVVVVFLSLLRHALTTGLVHMLEDGLLLAALCQVHLLNNLGPRQRPDLLFFNSFLIAFITGFFSQDLAWSVTFLTYAAVFLPALQVLAVLDAGVLPAPGLLRSVVRDAAPRTLLALLVTGAAFALWPRDFAREGWLGEQLQLQALARGEVGFSDEIRLDRPGGAVLSDREVMRIQCRDGGRAAVPTHWRGATFAEFDGQRWRAVADSMAGPATRTDQPWRPDRPGRWSRPAAQVGPELEVRLSDFDGGRLLLPPDAARLDWAEPFAAEQAAGLSDGNVVFERPRGRNGRTEPLVYRVAHGPADAKRQLRAGFMGLRRLRQLDPSRVPPGLTALARDLRGALPEEASAEEVAAHFAGWLQRERHYALPGAPDAAGNLAEFLLGHGGGHCEYFAATLAMLLRQQDIPCRVVSGYLASEWDGVRQEVVVRRRDAHAWVEVWSPGGSWLTVDPTPASGLLRVRQPAAGSFWQRASATLEEWWRQVAGFDGKGQVELLAALRRAPGRAARWLRDQPEAAAGLVALLLAWLLLRWQQRRRIPPSIRAWRAALKACRLRPQAGETPRELLARAQALPLPERRLAALAAATAAHERARYGGAGAC